MCDYENDGSDERVVYLSNPSVAKDKNQPKHNPLSQEGRAEHLYQCIQRGQTTI